MKITGACVGLSALFAGSGYEDWVLWTHLKSQSLLSETEGMILSVGGWLAFAVAVLLTVAIIPKARVIALGSATLLAFVVAIVEIAGISVTPQFDMSPLDWKMQVAVMLTHCILMFVIMGLWAASMGEPKEALA